ncbi:MAG: Ig-like domain-containing protein [Prevotella sp.]|nr:Ig-like domain-containing protein [Prevotella sp.]
MRYLRFILCLVCCNIIAALSAQNVLRVDTLRYPAGKTVTLPVVLENQSDIAGVQFDISVPYALKTDTTGQVAIELSRSRTTNHEVTVRDTGTSWGNIIKPSGYESLLYHNYRIVVYSSDNSLLVDNKGELLTMQFDLAADLPNTTILPVSLSRVVMGGQSQQNVADDPVSGAVVIEEIPRPDLTVANVSVNQSAVGPGDTMDIAWQVRNIGELPTAAGWSEQITLVSLSGTSRKVLTTTYFDGTLNNGSEVSRQATVTLPALLGIDGAARVEVQVIPYENAGEHPSDEDNNTVLSSNISITKQLVLELSRARVNEGSNQRIQLKLSRSGRWNNAYSFLVQYVALSTQQSDPRLPLPERVNIPAGQSGAVIYATVGNNDVLDNDSIIDITVSGDGYEPVTARLIIVDDEQPDLTLTPSKTLLTEGETFQLTVSAGRPAIDGSPIEVSLTSEDKTRFEFPPTVTIPAGQTAVTVNVRCLDNDVPNLELSNKFTAVAKGYNKGEAIVILQDNDMPVLTLALTPSQISEAAGPTAVAAVLTRTGKVDNKITIRISDDADGGLYYGNKSLEMPAGTESIYFNLGPVDNQLKEGDRTYNITAAIWVSSCNCSAAGEAAGSVTAPLTVLDNDGAALTVNSSASTVKEGGTTTLTVSRNTTDDMSQPLTVNLSSDYDEGLVYEHQVVIPAGQQSVQVEVQSKKNDVTGDSRTVVFTVSLEGYSSGTCFVLITDQTLPDARIAEISADPQEAFVNGITTIYIKVVNEGAAPLPEQTVVKLYRKGVKEAVATLHTQAAIAVDDSLTLSRRVALPDEVGGQVYYATVNEERTVTELQYTNNTSAEVTVNVLSPFVATVQTDKSVYTQSEPVVITGQIQVVDGASAVAGIKAEVYFVNDGARTTEEVETDADGNFTLTWTPFAMQAGHFAIGVCYPGDKKKDEMAGIDVYGLRRATTEYIKCDVPVGDLYQNTVALLNPGKLPLSGVKAEVVEGPENLDVQLTVPETIAGKATVDLGFHLLGSEATIGNKWENVVVRVTSAEGVSLDITLYYYGRAKKGNLEVASHQLITTMLKDEGRDISFIVTNTGKGNTGKVTLALPDWMKTLTGQTMPGLAQNDTATVVLRLTPTADMQLNVPVTGRIGINCENGNGTYINFSITPVSDAKGTLVVDVCDEYTYYTDEAPHVSGAEVVLRNAVTGALVAQGVTDSDGLWSMELPEGYYQLNVTADKHDSYKNNILVDPGTTTTKVVNLSYEAVSISWDVVETEVEDEYQIVTTVQYETRVPMPVVETIVPDRIAADSLGVGESLVFYAILTNKGLITAKETSFTFDKEYLGGYHWECLVPCEGIDLAPQQSLIVPVKVTKMGNEPSGARRSYELDDSGCANVCLTLYTWDCGTDNKMHYNPHSINFRVCPVNATLGGSGGSGGLGTGMPNGAGGGSSYEAASNGNQIQISDDCNYCISVISNTIRDCVLGNVPVVGCVYGVASGCMPLAFEDATLKDLRNCMDGIISCVPEVGTAYGLYVCKRNLEEAMMDCAKNVLGGKSRRRAPAMILPSYLVEYQRVVITAYKAMKAIIDYMEEFFGDEVWVTDVTSGEMHAVLDRMGEISNAGREMATVDFEDVKPMAVNEAQMEAFVERMNNKLDFEKTGALHENMIHSEVLRQCADSIMSADEEAQILGYISLQDMWETATNDVIRRLSENNSTESVCATISLQINQTMTLTRQAFRGTLTVFNGNEEFPMTDMKLRLNVTNLATNQVVTSHEMEMHTESLKGFEGDLDMESGWTLAGNETGVATILFIPTKYAAPEVDTEYSFGGTLSYIDPYTELEVTRDLYPVKLTVKPSPELDLTYFMQRDIYGDDAMTDDVEPMVPAEFAVIINNKGYGDATNVRMVTDQPKIIENKKGLFVNFEFVSSQLNGQEKTLALGQSIPTEFGTIGAHSQAYAQWWLQSTLLGHFVDYNIEATHVTSYGNEDLSLLDEVTIHELIHGFTPAMAEPAGRAFLVNDVLDADDLPDQVYFTDATQNDVHVTTNATVTKQSATEYLLTIRPNYGGWNYGSLLDPTVGKQTLVSITRQRDGQEIPVDNIWQTDRTLLDGQMWRYENRLHFVADVPNTVLSGSGVETFLLTFSPKPSVELAIMSIEGVPAEGTLQMEQLTEVTVNFNKAIDPVTFTADDITLNCQGVAQDASLITIERITDSTFKLLLNEVTLQNGYYVLTVQTAGITDHEGFNGAVGRQATWVQFVDGKVNLAIKAQPAEGGTVSPVSGQFDYEQPVTLTATPQTGYDFVRWMETAGTSSAASGYSASTGTYTSGGTTADGATVATDAIFTYTPTGDATLTAVFQPRNYNVSIDYESKGGTVEGGGTGLYPYGTTLTLTAKPAVGYLFEGWKVNGAAVPDGSGAPVPDGSPSGTITITVKGETTVEAVFTLQPNITLTGRVINANDGTPIMGATISLTVDDLTYTATSDYQGRYTLDIADRTLNYAVLCEADGYMWSPSEVIWFTEGSQVKDFALIPGATVILPDNGVCTFASKEALDLSDTSIQAYYVTSYNNGSFILSETTCAAAGEGIILKGAVGERVDIPLLPAAARATALENPGNLLVGTAYAPYTVGDDQVYLLNENQEEAHFYRADKGYVVPMGKAFVLYTLAIDEQTVNIIWSETTLIEMVQKALQDEDTHYNMGGQPMHKNAKGVHIIRGKKTVVGVPKH